MSRAVIFPGAFLDDDEPQKRLPETSSEGRAARKAGIAVSRPVEKWTSRAG
jgi:hypothetical protein